MVRASSSLAGIFPLRPVSTPEDFKIKVSSKQGKIMKSPYGPCPHVRWLGALPSGQMAAQGCPFSGTPPARSGGRGVPDSRDWADTPEYGWSKPTPYQMPSGHMSPPFSFS